MHASCSAGRSTIPSVRINSAIHVLSLPTLTRQTSNHRADIPGSNMNAILLGTLHHVATRCDCAVSCCVMLCRAVQVVATLCTMSCEPAPGGAEDERDPSVKTPRAIAGQAMDTLALCLPTQHIGPEVSRTSATVSMIHAICLKR